MKVVKTNQDLIVGRKYLTRTKPILLQNGTYSKPVIEIQHIGEEVGRRYVGNGRFWAYDEHDGFISWNDNQRLEAEAKAMNLPVSEMIVIPSDYEVNSQALERWDMIGPIPEINEGILHLLFEHPELSELFERPISLHPDGNIAVLIDSVDDEWHLLTDKEDAIAISNYLAGQKEDSIKWVEEIDNLPDQFPVSNVIDNVDESGFVTTESCGDKVGKRIRLTEKKHNQFGYYNEGAVLTIHQLVDPTGYIAGVVNPNNPDNRQNLVNVGFDGFEFVD